MSQVAQAHPVPCIHLHYALCTPWPPNHLPCPAPTTPTHLRCRRAQRHGCRNRWRGRGRARCTACTAPHAGQCWPAGCAAPSRGSTACAVHERYRRCIYERLGCKCMGVGHAMPPGKQFSQLARPCTRPVAAPPHSLVQGVGGVFCIAGLPVVAAQHSHVCGCHQQQAALRHRLQPQPGSRTQR